MVAELVLGAGIVTGMALQYLASGELLAFDHKTVLSLLAFAIIAAPQRPARPPGRPPGAGRLSAADPGLSRGQAGHRRADRVNARLQKCAR
jgi:hypothetical protein